MKFSFMASVVAIALQVGTATAQTATDETSLKTKADSVAYAFGLAIGDDLKRTGVEALDPAVMMTAINAVFREERRTLSEEEQREVITGALTEAYERRNEPLIAAAKAFMEDNRAKPGIITTASGLQYEVIREGSAEKPLLQDTVTVHYRGVLADGQQFDSSYDRGEPATFPLNLVIPGWQEGLQLMGEGAHYRLYIPYELGYGERGSGSMIPPFSPLVFDVELVDVARATPTTPPSP